MPVMYLNQLDHLRLLKNGRIFYLKSFSIKGILKKTKDFQFHSYVIGKLQLYPKCKEGLLMALLFLYGIL